MRSIVALLAFLVILVRGASIYAADPAPVFSAQAWCADPLSFCSTEAQADPTSDRSLFGFRLLIDVQFNLGYFGNIDDKVTASINGAFGVQLPLIGGYLAADIRLYPPFEVAFEPNADVKLKDPKKNVGVKFGTSLGVSVLQGLVHLGFGVLFYDPDDFVRESFPVELGGFLTINVGSARAYLAALDLNQYRKSLD